MLLILQISQTTLCIVGTIFLLTKLYQVLFPTDPEKLHNNVMKSLHNLTLSNPDSLTGQYTPSFDPTKPTVEERLWENEKDV